MALRSLIQYLRKEHGDLQHLADRIERMLESASKKDFLEHWKSLTGLRSLEHGLVRVVAHCRTKDRSVESTYHLFLQQADLARMGIEHEQIIRAVTNFREELKCATADRTMAMIVPGMDVVNRLRTHIAYERELLGRIVELASPTNGALDRRKTGKRARGIQIKRTAKRTRGAKATSVLPYTLEPHPEL